MLLGQARVVFELDLHLADLDAGQARASLDMKA